jgi:hypothetical protein
MRLSQPRAGHLRRSASAPPEKNDNGLDVGPLDEALGLRVC